MTSRRRPLFLAFAAGLLAATATAATYLPLSDADLARRSPLIAHGRVISQAVRLEKIGDKDFPFTFTAVQVLEAIQGSAASTIVLRLPGGRIGDLAWSIPGTPTFTVNQEVLLLMRPAEGRPGVYHLSEFGLSRFDIVEDESGRRFATRPAFDPEEDLYLSQRAVAMRERAPGSRPTPLRDAESLLSALRAAARGEAMPAVAYAEPKGPTSDTSVIAPRTDWINIGGLESTLALFRWFWDTGASPSAVVTITGTQSNLSDSSNGLAHAQNGIDQWHGIAASDIRVSGPSGGGNIAMTLDATTSYDGTAWTTPLPCGTGGTIGLGGPGQSFGPRVFKSATIYFSPSGGSVSMRQRTGAAGCYEAAVFRTAVMHELGHVLGLGHPDGGSSSIHSTTPSSSWTTAVMTATVPVSRPSTPQTDDLQAMQYYYGTGAVLCVSNATTMCLNNGRFKLTVSWVSPTASGLGQQVPLTTDTGYFWFFADTNVEMVVKVLNACGVNAHYWVFAGGLTNVAVTMTVTDMQTGLSKIYSTTQGPAFPPIQDTTAAAFATCP